MMLVTAKGEALPSTTTLNGLRKSVSNSKEFIERGKQSHVVETLNPRKFSSQIWVILECKQSYSILMRDRICYAELPIARNLSLQQFLQKRNDRVSNVSNVILYATSSK
ncbi:hypothetical protein SUGI_0788230 [Cryptomeria japonica]|nr:hypothetical protein SUGI_0788230 [Cryptomeria japonica]